MSIMSAASSSPDIWHLITHQQQQHANQQLMSSVAAAAMQSTTKAGYQQMRRRQFLEYAMLTIRSLAAFAVALLSVPHETREVG